MNNFAQAAYDILPIKSELETRLPPVESYSRFLLIFFKNHHIIYTYAKLIARICARTIPPRVELDQVQKSHDSKMHTSASRNKM